MPITLSAARIKLTSSTLPEHGFESPPWNNGASTHLHEHMEAMQKYSARQYFYRNETIFGQKGLGDQVYKIISGTARLCRYASDGRRSIVEFPLPGDLMGFANNSDQPICAEAVTEVTAIVYPRACLEQLVLENPAAHRRLLGHLSENLLAAQQHMFVLGCQKAKERAASFLLWLAARLDVSAGETLDLAMSRQDIADHLGVTIETISRAFTALRSDGSIMLPNAHQVVLRDIDGLRLLAAGS